MKENLDILKENGEGFQADKHTLGKDMGELISYHICWYFEIGLPERKTWKCGKTEKKCEAEEGVQFFCCDWSSV